MERPESAEKPKSCILVIEDNPDIREVIQQILEEDCDVEVTAVSTCEEGIALLRNGEKKFKGVFTDMNTKTKATGLEVATECAALGIPFKIVSADTEIPKKLLKHTIRKPVDMQVLIAECREMVNRSLGAVHIS